MRFLYNSLVGLTETKLCVILWLCGVKSVKLNLFPVNTGRGRKLVLNQNARGKGRFKMKKNGGLKTLIISSAWAKRNFGEKIGIATAGFGNLPIGSTQKNTNKPIKSSARNICGNT
jgi:hypothetical protein